MNGKSSVTLIFIIVILKSPSHTCGNTLWAKCNLTFMGNTALQKPVSMHERCCMRWQIVNKLFLHYSRKLVRVIQWQIIVERTIHNKPIDTAT